MLLKLKGKTTISKQVDSIIGWGDSTVYEPIWINSDHIESMSFVGLTILRMTSGQKHEVQSTPEEIVEMMTNGK